MKVGAPSTSSPAASLTSLDGHDKEIIVLGKDKINVSYLILSMYIIKLMNVKELYIRETRGFR